MSYSRTLSEPIVTTDDRRFQTLADVVEFMMALPERHQQNHHWEYAGEAIMRAAAEKSTAADLAEAEKLIRTALYWERLLLSQ